MQDKSTASASVRYLTKQSGQAARRKVLKSVLAGGVVVTAGSVPVKWVAPVVQSVVLPAHAQTSRPQAVSGPDGCSALVIPGQTVSCPVPGPLVTTRTNYQVDDTGPCPVLTQSVGSESPTTDDVIQVGLRQNITSANNVGISVRVNGSNFSLFVGCGSSPDGSSFNNQLTFESLSGVTYQADVTLTINGGPPNFVTLSDITLTPIP